MAATTTYDIFLNFHTKMNGKASGKGKAAVADPFSAIKAGAAKSGKFIDKSLTQVKALNNVFGELRDMEVMKNMGQDASMFNDRVMQLQKTTKNLGGNFTALQASAKKMSRQFDMSMLSIMFFGMLIQRIFQGIFSQMLNSFKMIDKKGIQPISRAMTKMQAAWTFLGFSIIKAMEPLLLPVLDIAARIFDWFAQLPPEILMTLGTLTAALGALGAAMMIIGSVGLGLPALMAKLAVGVGNVAGAFTALGATATLGIGGLFTGIAVAVILLVAAFAVFQASVGLMTDSGEEMNDMFAKFGNTIGMLGPETSSEFDVVKGAWLNLLDALQTGLGFFIVGLTGVANQAALLFMRIGNDFAFLINSMKKASLEVQRDFFGADVAVGLGEVEAEFLRIGDANKEIERKNDEFAESAKAALDSIMENSRQRTDAYNLEIQEKENLIEAEANYNELLAKQKVLQDQLFRKEGGFPVVTALDKEFADVDATTIASDLERMSGELLAYQEALGLVDESSKNLVEGTRITTSGIAEEWANASTKISEGIKLGIEDPVTNQIGYTEGSPPTEGALSETPMYAENFIKGYSDSMTETAPYLNETMSVVFTEATDIMKNIVHTAVEETISDVNRAIASLRSLESERGRVNLSETTTNTNNNFTINAARGTDITRSIRNANIAAPRRNL